MSNRPRTIKEILADMPVAKVAEQKTKLKELLLHEPEDFEKDRKLTSYPKVYVLITKDFEYIKIGTALDIKKRMSNIQSGCPFDLTLWIAIATPLARGIESGLHDVFCDYQLRGEWFHLPKDQLDLLMVFFNAANKRVREVRSALLQA